MTPATKPIHKILIANRGEIALRIMRSAKEMGIKTVAVYSEADKPSPHVKYADEAVCIGPPPSNQSYLMIDVIIKVCKDLNVDAIHPGYGFLSENAEFAEKVAASGILFIGPSPESIRIMGSKLAAKEAVSKFDIPLVPGTENSISDVRKAEEVAREIGYPLLIKASAGGGGKGMRVVEEDGNLGEELNRAMSEAKSAFGDGSVFIERYISRNKHIEFQILGDQHGNVIHLFERECSIQRRHQKVIEEAPSAILTSDVREEMGRAAVMVAKACGYYSAGTVEFIYDEDGKFYFLEMNTRLQVEHPVTEEITGIDLVKEQIRIAEGHELSLAQDDLQVRGHAIEVRVYAEDPFTGFLPDIGRLEIYEVPQGPGIRVDDGFAEGMEIPIHYDPMISKLITHGRDRDEAIVRMNRAIDEYDIVGVETTLSFCKFVINHPSFLDGSFTTNFVEKYFHPEELTLPADVDDDELKALLLAAQYVYDKDRKKHIPPIPKSLNSKWKFRNR